MSEETLEEYNEKGELIGSKKITRDDLPARRIVIEKGKGFAKGEKTPLEKAERKAEKYDEMASGIAQRLNTKYDTDVFSQKDLTEMMVLDKLLSAQQKETHKPSKGSISLQTGNYDPDESPLTREYDTQREMIEDLYKHAWDVKSPYHREAKEAKKQLKEQFGEGVPNMKLEFASGFWEQEAVRELGRKFTHGQYTRWLQEKMKELSRNAT